MINISNNHSRHKAFESSEGFSAVELLITLFIAAAFLFTGYQLYRTITADSTQARMQSRASNAAYDFLQQAKLSATSTCAASNTTTTPTVDKLVDVSLNIEVTCPYTEIPSISKIVVTLTHGLSNDRQKVYSAGYINVE